MRRSAAALAAGIMSLSSGAAVYGQQPVPLDTVRVAAGSRLIAGAASLTRSVDVFDRAAIDALPARSVSDVIARALGADLLARSPAQADLSIRGGSFEQILVLVDGVPVNDRQTGHFHLDLAVPLDAVERIEVLRGPASAIHGSSAIGGVVNIVTRRGRPEVVARAQGGSFGSYAVGAGAGLTTGGLSARVDADVDASNGHRDGTDHRATQARVTLGGPLGPGMVQAAAGYAARDFGANEFYAPYDSYEETRTAVASLAWRSRPATLVLEPRLSFRQHDDDFILVRDDPSLYRNRHTTRETGAELVARWQAGGRIALAAGGEAHRSEIESNSLGERHEDQVAGFAEAAIGDEGSALLTLGLRLDNHSTFGTFLSSSAAAAYRLSPGFLLRASAGSGFRAPSWTDRYYEDPANIGSPDLDPERFWTGELGAAWSAGPLSLDIAGFIRHADDLIDWGRAEGEADTQPWFTMNVAQARFRGVEATVRADAGIVTVTGRGSLLSFDAETTPGYVSKYALQPLTRSAAVDLAVRVTSAGVLTMRGTASRRADGTAWETIDARASASFAGVHLFVDATNLLDASWLDVAAQPVAGRAFSVGVRVRR